MSREMLRFEHLAAGYGEKDIIKDVSFSVEEGDFAGLIGSNGAGKSTLIKCISGLLPVRSGNIYICGKENSHLKHRERARLVAVVPQSYHVDYDFLVEDIVMMGRNPYLSLRHKENERDMEIVRNAMEATNTEIFRGRLYNELSGGERQRVILARAIAQEPQIILLDEPTSALDIHHQIEVMELITRLNKEKNMTVLAVLHDINMASRFCKRLIMLKDGHIMADGTPETVINRQNMEELYQMKLLIHTNPLFRKPEIVPLRVMDTEKCPSPLHIHVICGASEASQIIEELDSRGYRITAGVVNVDSDDWMVCRSLHLPMVEIPPFTPVTDKSQHKNLKMMEDADIILVASVPFGMGNLKNLDGLENLKGQIFFHKNSLSSDYTDGALVKRLEEIGEHKKITYFGDHDEFLSMLDKIHTTD